MISPHFFAGLSIFVSMDDERQKEIVKKTLAITGSSIVEDPSARADLIVTDKPAVPSRLTRGQRMAAAAGTSRLVRTEQIPWALTAERVCPTDSDRVVVVADTLQEKRPQFKTFREPITLFFDGSRFGGSPFSQGQPRPQALYAPTAVITRDGPPDRAMCEICGRCFASACEHRVSQEHIEKASGELFARLDAVANAIWRLGRLNVYPALATAE